MEEQRVALVTGGARRVGRAIVERLAEAGFAVAFTYHMSEDDAGAVYDSCGAWPIKADLSDPEAGCKELVETVDRFADRLDVLVNNASTFEPADLRHTDLALSRRLMAVHVESPLLLCKAFEAKLRRSAGHIVNLVDLMAERPWPQYLAYCVSKAALANLTLGLARDLAPDVTVNGIAPGVVAWPDDMPDEQRETYLKRVPLARPGTPADVADLVHFLVTSGRYVTGQILRLDGGRSIT